MTTHAWMPASPCGSSCLPTVVPHVRRSAVLARWLSIAFTLCTFPFLVGARVLPVAIRRGVVTGGARLLLRAIGIRLDVTGGRRAGPTPDGQVGTLVVANHVSWTDIVVLAALFPARFVARADLLDWPVLGTVSRLVRVIPIERRSLRALPATVDQVADLLRSGSTVVVFPEGTTWCGRAYGTFRPALFQAAIDAGAPVLPVSIDYRGGDGNRATAVAFVGDEGIGGSVRRIVRMSGLRVGVRIGDPAAPTHDRRVMAAYCQHAVHGPADLPNPVTVSERFRPRAEVA